VIEYNGKRGKVFRIKYADADGRQVMETVGAARDGVTRKKAKAELRERLVRVERKAWRKPAPLTFNEYAEQWFVEEEVKRRWKPGTVRTYRFTRERLVEAFGPMRLAEVRPRHVAGYVAGLSGRRGASVVRRDIAVLHAIFRSALAAELVQTNPAAGVEQPKLPTFRPVLLEPVEVRRVMRSFTDPQARAVFLTLHLTGLRRFELQGLRWRDVSLTERTIRVADSKTEKGRRLVAIPAVLAEELERHYQRTAFKGDGERVFCNAVGGKLDAGDYREAFHEALATAGVDKRPRPFHDAHHGALTQMAANGSSPLAIMTTAGHGSMQTTKRYLHLAGTVFPDEAEKLSVSLGLSTELSTDLTAPQAISGDVNGPPDGLQA
jgi:integrase